MLSMLQLLILELYKLLQILFCFIYSALLCNRTLLLRVNTDYTD